MSDNKIFAGSYTVRVGDINYGGHLGNDNALLLFHDARLHFLGQFGFSENDIGGPGIILREAHVYYRKEVFRGNELKVYVHVEDLHEVSFVMHYTVVREEEEVIYGSTKLIAYDYDKRRVVKVPESLLRILNK